MLWADKKSGAPRRRIEPIAAPPAADEKPNGPALRPPPREGEPGLERVRLRCLSQLALLCGRDDLETDRILTEIADLLPSATGAPETSCCRIEFAGEACWSPGYREPTTRLERALHVGEAKLGSLTLGRWGSAARQPFDAALEEFVTAAAQLIGQMLGRRADRRQLETQGAELTRRAAALEQIRRLAKLGGWEFDAAAGAFTWSNEARRIAGLDKDPDTVLQREELIGAFIKVAIDEAVPTRKPINQEVPCVQPDGTRRWLHVLGEVEVAGAKLVRAFGIVREITDEKERQTRLSRLANHDPLTGLANRRHLLDRLDSSLIGRRAAGALLLIDLDNFKDVNDAGGHDSGDALLKAVARRLEEAAGRSAFVARLGGDEFVVLLLKEADKGLAERWAETLLAKLREPLAVAGRAVSIRASAGLTVYPAEGQGAAELLKNADLAVYAAKARGRNVLVSYDPSLREESRNRLALCAEVKEALDTDAFVPFYQPKVCLKTGHLVGFEALLRWQHRTGLRAPGGMLPALEVPDLSRRLCARILDCVVADVSSWRERSLPFGRVAFNASSSEFTGFDLVEAVLGRLKAAGVPPSCLGLEVTETVFLGSGSSAIGPILEALHKAGVEIALDDFGTGYASLTHLQEYPVDVIKIDQSFIRGLITDPASQAITSVVLGLGRSLGMKVVAEGVETAEQAGCLKTAGCDQVQGYYFARPMPAEEVPDFLGRWRGAEEVRGLPYGGQLLGKLAAQAA